MQTESFSATLHKVEKAVLYFVAPTFIITIGILTYAIFGI